MPLYAVGIAWNKNDRWITVEAKNANDAKHQWCKRFGRKFNDPWCGASMLEAKKVR
jgi:hypothetical protein